MFRPGALYDLFLWLRSLLFYLGYVPFTAFWATLSLLCAWPLPAKQRFYFIIGAWTRFTLFWLRLTCGVRIRLLGAENIPATPCVIFSKHQSPFETFYLQQLFAPAATVIKKELLIIPFFGWAFSLLRPITVDRSHPRSSLKRLLQDGEEKLRQKQWIILFPEGTRIPPGETAPFQRGGAMLAAKAAALILPVAHNAGTYWPAHRFRKYPGTITVSVGAPIAAAEGSSVELNRRAKSWIDAETQKLEASSDA